MSQSKISDSSGTMRSESHDDVALQLSELAEQLNRPLRVLHLGNHGNNAWKLASRATSEHVKHCVFDVFSGSVFDIPEWEEGKIHFADRLDSDFNIDMIEISDYRRPGWVFQGPDQMVLSDLWSQLFGGFEQQKVAQTSNRLAFLARLGAQRPETIRSFFQGERGQYPQRLRGSVNSIRSGNFDERRDLVVDFFTESSAKNKEKIEAGDFDTFRPQRDDAQWPQLFSAFDCVVAYGHEVARAALHSSVPFLYIDFGELREVQSLQTPESRRVALGASVARRVALTNPDCLGEVEALGIKDCVFMPHLISDYFYRDSAITINHSEGPYVLAIAQQNWSLKRNDIAIRAFANISKQFPDLGLKIVSWGPDAERARSLVRELGISHKTEFALSMPVRDLAEEVKGAEAVLNQFRVGVLDSLGAATMASGTPLVTRVDAPMLDWAYSDPPCFSGDDEDSTGFALIQALTCEKLKQREAQQSWMRRNFAADHAVKALNQFICDVLLEAGKRP